MRSGKTYYTDFHCHPAIKPFGKSFPDNLNSADRHVENSIWHRIRPNLLSRLLNRISSLTRFTQTDFTTLARGRVRLIVAALSPIERGFFTPLTGQGEFTDLVADFVTMIGREKVAFIQQNQNYFSELNHEMDFFLQMNDKPVTLGRKIWKYQIVDGYDRVQQILEQEGKRVICVIPAIEGMHVFLESLSKKIDIQRLRDNIISVKHWLYPPLCISPAHHFQNGLCGHAYSLSPVLRKLLNQDKGANQGFSSAGLEAIQLLLDSKQGRRILIDIKHMSRKARREFYNLLDEEGMNEIPVIVSHGAVNGRPSVYSDEDHGAENGQFQGEDVNFYDDEIVRLARSGGIFGIQLDERRIVSKTERRRRRSLNPWKNYRDGAGFLWKQIEYIALLLDRNGLSAWNHITLGSDFDGMVDPLNGYWTGREYARLEKYFLRQARYFVSRESVKLEMSQNKISAEKIADRFFRKNLLQFLKKNY